MECRQDGGEDSIEELACERAQSGSDGRPCVSRCHDRHRVEGEPSNPTSDQPMFDFIFSECFLSSSISTLTKTRALPYKIHSGVSRRRQEAQMWSKQERVVGLF